MDRGIREGEKGESSSSKLKTRKRHGIFDTRERQAPVDYIVLQVTNPRISVCTSPDACIPLSLSSLGANRREKIT
jgi:hypothetical protein